MPEVVSDSSYDFKKMLVSCPQELYRVDSFQARAALTNRNSRVSKNEGAEL
jgi:hypothetical protein